MLFGAHESVAGGLENALVRGAVDGCEAIQIFTKNSSTWREPEVTEERITAFHAAHALGGRVPLLSHTSYLLNLATDDAQVLARSKDALVAEILRSSALGVAYVVLHPGAHLGAGAGVGIARIAANLDEVHERTAGASARILLENTAGQGTCIGHRFEELGAIMAEARTGDRLGVCFDTQHAYAAGYDLGTRKGYDATFRDLERHVGLARVLAFHLNDSKKQLGSRVDRHEHVGVGSLGLPVFRMLANDERFARTPAVVEVAPRDRDTPYKQDVSLLKSLVKPAR